MIQKLLIANRGEIAVRIIKACRELGIRTVAVYSDADRHAMHTMMADEAVDIGASAPAESYLDGAKIIEAAKSVRADAIHPGYGFLSERASFSQACADAGLIFVGPQAAAMRRLGDKISSKKLAVETGVPITPGFFEPSATSDQIIAEAERLGFPVMLKASAGGGGRGMRIVREAENLAQELAIASDEALKAFGDGSMMVEKLIERPRHIEVQILADGHGTIAPLFERECSIQRRHQKLIEESPAATDAGFWDSMKDAAVRLCAAAGYVGAGTVEFMLDPASGEFFFLEVNARLQVEHPVTELVVGIDIVQWQLRIASGERLDLPDELLAGNRNKLGGHAIEARIVAEDPSHSFLPSAGRILAWAEPKSPGVRVDTGFGAGSEVTRFYDSLLAKVIAHAETRQGAIDRLISALEDFHILGVKTNIAYLLDVLRHPGFQAGKIDTGFLEREFSDWSSHSAPPPELGALLAQSIPNGAADARADRQSRSGAWDAVDDWRVV